MKYRNTLTCKKKLHPWIIENKDSDGGCKLCRRAGQRRRFAAHPEKIRAWHRAFHYRHRERRIANNLIYQMKKLYGLSPEQYQIFFNQQNGCCAICERPQQSFAKKLSVDHDHKTGKVRGLLCGICNAQIVGVLENPLFLKALTYLGLEVPVWANSLAA